MKQVALFLGLAIFLLVGCQPKNQFKTQVGTDANGYKYSYVTNDPYKLRIYTLKNGLTVYLSPNTDEPRIQAFIPVKAGSTYDPADNTGLAHYLEHMMFKGTSNIGTVNWDEEKKLIDQISALYEQHKFETDTVKKKVLYARIDSLSQIAASYVAPSEYEKLISSVGGSDINAYTTNERTVYMSSIPSNEIEKWLKLESERFFDPVLRVFHTELETVYEEFNMGQDRDGTKAYQKTMSMLFPTHPYGQQTTIGKAEHLKNPSMENILKYQHTYYVPNNMAICLSGDLDYEKTIQLVDKYFGQQPESPVAEVQMPVEKPLDTITVADVYGPQAEFIYLGYRFDGIKSTDQKMVTLIDYMLSNAQAGLIDIDLNQQQKILRGASFTQFLKEYGMHILQGVPRQGQSLEEVRDLLLAEIEKIKKGDFDDWLIEACINDLKLQEIKAQESNERAHTFAVSFANGMLWEDELKFYDELSKITKEQVVAFANEKYRNNYIVVNKRKGIDTTVIKVDKPTITPVNLNREHESAFASEFQKIESGRLTPAFVNFDSLIQKQDLAQGVKFSYIANPTNKLFNLTYIVEMGKNNDKKLSLAVGYLPFIGTDRYTAAQLKQEMFRYGLQFGVSTSDDKSYVYISGLEENAAKGIELLEHILSNAQPDTVAYKKYIEGILKSRADAKLDKSTILFRGMMSYAMYGPTSSFTNNIPESELMQINPAELTALIKSITSYEHQVFYYGQNNLETAFNLVKQYHILPAQLQPIPEPVKFAQLDITQPQVYFVNYDMVQAQVVRLTKDQLLQNQLVPQINLFNEYYGAGLSSIVFQEMRESRGGVYSAYSFFTIPEKADKAHYNYSFIATQPDKVEELMAHFNSILNKMPEATQQFNITRESIQKQIESQRIIKDNIFWTAYAAQKRGVNYDDRKDVYDYVKTASMADFETFFNEHVANKQAVYLVIANKSMINFKSLSKLGPVKELTIDEIFNY